MRIGIAALIALLAAAPPASAAQTEHPVELPRKGIALAANAGQPWLVGVDARQGGLHAALRRLGARPGGSPTTYVVPASRARSVAGLARRHRALLWAHRDHRLSRRAEFEQAPAGTASPRGRAVNGATAPGAPDVPIGVVDDAVDRTHPDLGNTRVLNGAPVADSHGTAVASAAAGARNGAGVVGIVPGAPILSWGTDLTCSDVARGTNALIDAGAKVINLSLGGPSECIPTRFAIERAVARNVVVVAAAGNEFLEGNPVSYPAALPHVLSVAALTPDDESADFSTSNAAVDLSAPGVEIPVAVPQNLDPDGRADGLTLMNGTSFSAPIVAGAAAWIRQARPGLDSLQVGDVLRFSAREVDEQGWDRNTGYGALDVAAALREREPPADVLEPNEFVASVSGAQFGRPDPFVWTGTGRKTLRATVDEVEDPRDIYRVRVPGRATVRIRLIPLTSGGDADLYALPGNARTVSARPIDRSIRGPGKIDTVSLVNSGRSARSVLLVVPAEDELSTSFDTTYRLEFARLRRR